MFAIIVLLVASASAGVIQHGEHGGATSYQHVRLESYHPVPVFVKKEHSPVPKGVISSDLQLHHGDVHEHGYAALAAIGHGDSLEGIPADHQGAALGDYEGAHEAELQGHAEQEGLASYEGHGLEPAGLGAYGAEHEAYGHHETY